jgi:hypothetical protein
MLVKSNEIEEVTILTSGSVMPFAHSRSRKAHIEALAGRIEDVAYMPILTGAASIAEIVATNFLSEACK